MSLRTCAFGRRAMVAVATISLLSAPVAAAPAGDTAVPASWSAVVGSAQTPGADRAAPAYAPAKSSAPTMVPSVTIVPAKPASWSEIAATAPQPRLVIAQSDPARGNPVADTSAAGNALAQAQPEASDANDPLEPLNRAIFGFNEFLYALIIRPLAEFYVLVLPQEARDGISNFLTNVRTPVVLANDLLQGEGNRAWVTTERFFINSTVGLGGIIDVARRWGIEGHDEDLGQTFAVWGVPEAFYLVLPILGPSNPRDAVGKFLDGYLDPINYWANNTDREEITWSRTVVSGIDSYSRVMDELKKLKETSVDYYAAIRSISRQKRDAEIRNGAPADVPLPDIRYDFNADLSK